MALVATPIKFSRGSIGNVSFYQDRKGRCIARLRPEKVDDFYDNPRRKSQVRWTTEFGANSRLAKHISRPSEHYLKYCTDASWFNRMMGVLRLASDADYNSVWGDRRSTRGNISLLEGFEYNKDRHLSAALDAEYTTHIDTTTGSVQVDIESFIPCTAVKAPDGARFCQLVAVATAANHENYITATEVTNLLPVRSREAAAHSLSLQLKNPNNMQGELLVVSLGVLFYEEYNGVPLLLRDGALSIIATEKMKEPVSEGSEVPGNEAGAVLTAEKIRSQVELKLENRFPCMLVTGDTNTKPAGDIDYKVHRLRHHLWRQKLERHRKG